jgi:hypothetical protein
MNRHDLVIAIALVLAFALIAVPFQIESSYWADSTLAWTAYAVIGLLLALYIAYAFLQARRHLMSDAERDRREVEP